MYVYLTPQLGFTILYVLIYNNRLQIKWTGQVPTWCPPFLQKVSKYSCLCNIGSLRVQSPITNIVYCSSDTGSIGSHQTLSFPLQTDMNSPDSTGIGSTIVWQSTNKTRQTREDRSLPKHLMAEMIPPLDDILRKSCLWNILIWIEAILCFGIACSIRNCYLLRGWAWPFC